MKGLSEGAPCQSLLGNVMGHHVPEQRHYGKGGGSHPLKPFRVLSSLCIVPLGHSIYALLWLQLPSIWWRFPNQHSYFSVYFQLPPSILTCHVQSYIHTFPLTCPFTVFPISVPGPRIHAVTCWQKSGLFPAPFTSHILINHQVLLNIFIILHSFIQLLFTQSNCIPGVTLGYTRPVLMEFTAVGSSEATNTSHPYYRWPPISLPSSSFPPLWRWGILVKHKSDHCSHLPKTLQWHPLPSRSRNSSAWPLHGSQDEASLTACLLSGPWLLLLSLRLSPLSLSMCCFLPRPQPQNPWPIQSYCSSIS